MRGSILWLALQLTLVVQVGNVTGIGNVGVIGLAPPNALIAEWQMADGAGITALDSCCGDNLTITSGTWGTQTGLSNGALIFNGSSTHADSSNATMFDFERIQPFSVAAWFAVTSTGNEQALVGRLDTTNNYRGWEVMIQYDTACVNAYSVEFFLISTYPSNVLEVHSACVSWGGGLRHLVVTYNGNSHPSGVSMYLDGSSIGVVAVYDTLSGTIRNSQGLRLGGRMNGSCPLGAKVGPTYIWNRALGQSDAMALYSAPYAVVH